MRRLFWKGSVRTRLLILVAFASVPSLIGTLWLFAIERRDAVARVQQSLERRVAQAEAEHAALLDLGTRVLRTAALDDEIARGNQAECELALSRLTAVAPELLNPTRTNAKGIVDCLPGRTAGVDVSKNPYFLRTIATDSLVIGPYRRSISLPEPVVPINIRLRDDDGRITGVLSVGLRMRWLQTLSKRLALPEGSVILLMDAAGEVLARFPDGGRVGQRHPTTNFAQRIAAGRANETSLGTGLDGVTRFIASAHLPAPLEMQVAIAIAVPVDAVTSDANRSLALRMTLLIAALALSALIAWIAARPVVLGDLNALGAMADRVGTGDFSARTGVVGAPKEVQRVAAAMDDMATKLGEREERQLQAQKLESLGRLSGGVAHDFNNLLTAILGHVEDVRDSLPLGSPGRESLDIALEAARRSGALSRQLLAFARGNEVAAEEMSLDPVLQETSQLLRRTLGTAISITVESRATRRVSADRGRLEQALVNLALNARDAMPEGGALTLSSSDEAGVTPADGLPLGDWVRLDVSDNGAGMSPDVISRVFEPFFTTKPPGQGTGLGLAMVIATMQQFGGTATVQSAPGQGTTVSLWFPAVDDSAEGRAKRATPADGVAVTRAEGHVLLVDDEAAVRSFASRALRRAGFTVTEATDGAAALQIVTERGIAAFDLLVSDVVMPKLGGVALAESLRAAREDFPIVLMSGYAGDQSPAEVLRMPRTKFLDKPFKAADLLKAIAEVRGA